MKFHEGQKVRFKCVSSEHCWIPQYFYNVRDVGSLSSRILHGSTRLSSLDYNAVVIDTSLMYDVVLVEYTDENRKRARLCFRPETLEFIEPKPLTIEKGETNMSMNKTIAKVYAQNTTKEALLVEKHFGTHINEDNILTEITLRKNKDEILQAAKDLEEKEKEVKK